MKAVKVAWDNCFAQRNATGTGVYASHMIAQLRKAPAVDLSVLTGWPGPPAPDSNSVLRAFTFAGNLAWTHADLPFRLWKNDFDVLHSPAFIAPVKTSCPVVITMHDVTYLLYPSYFAPWWVAYMKAVAPITVASAAAIICGSEHSKKDLTAAYGVPAQRVHVIPYGVDHHRFHPGAALDQNWAEQTGLSKSYVLHVGEFSYRKNIPTLLRAVARLRSLGKWGERQLVLAGAAKRGMLGAEEIYETMEQLELSDTVLLTGRAPDEQLAGLYANASLLVMPSRYEGFGFPVLEAMAAGTPVIASDSSCLPEVSGGAAILTPAEDATALSEAIFEVLTKPSLAATLRSKGLKRAGTFTWERTGSETVKLYRCVAS
jgi:glycosyltransferase involved in cell wall biosynthesis